MPELKTSVRWKNFRWAFAGLGGGAGVAVGIAAIKALTARPEFLQQLLSGGFLGFTALTIGMVMFRKQFAEFNVMQGRHAAAQEQLALNVGNLVAKISLQDEATAQRDREREITLNHLARKMDETFEHVVELRKERGGE